MVLSRVDLPEPLRADEGEGLAPARARSSRPARIASLGVAYATRPRGLDDRAVPPSCAAHARPRGEALRLQEGEEEEGGDEGDGRAARDVQVVAREEAEVDREGAEGPGEGHHGAHPLRE